MNKLTLPIEIGKKYIRRDGEVITTAASPYDHIVCAGVGSLVYLISGAGNHNDFSHSPYDLIADYIEEITAPTGPPVTGHIHAASMLLYAQDATETDKPWLRWEFDDTQGRVPFLLLNDNPKWNDTSEYRRKPPEPAFIDINGYQVPAPMRVAPEVGSEYWYAHITSDVAYSSRWDGDISDKSRLNKGLCHEFEKSAKLHNTALLSFTRITQ